MIRKKMNRKKMKIFNILAIRPPILKNDMTSFDVSLYEKFFVDFYKIIEDLYTSESFAFRERLINYNKGRELVSQSKLLEFQIIYIKKEISLYGILMKTAIKILNEKKKENIMLILNNYHIITLKKGNNTRTSLEFPAYPKVPQENSSLYLEKNLKLFKSNEIPSVTRRDYHEIMVSLLKGSGDTLLELENYALHNNREILEINQVKTMKPNSKENYFIIGNNAYFFTLNQWQEIHEIISTTRNLDTLKKTLGKRPNVLRNITTSIEACVDNLLKIKKQSKYEIIYKAISSTNLVSIIVKSLNHFIIKHYTNYLERENVNSNKSFFKISYSTLSLYLGTLIGNTYLNYVLIKNKNDLPLNRSEPNTKNRKSIYSVKSVNRATITDFIQIILDKTVTKASYANIFDIKIENEDIFNYLNNSMLREALLSDTMPLQQNSPVKTRGELDIKLDKFHLQLGSIFIDNLISANIISQVVDSRHKVPYIELSQDIVEYLPTSATFNKPPLVLNLPEVVSTHTIDSSLEINLFSNEKYIRQSQHVHLKSKPIMDEIRNSLSFMTIPVTPFKDFLQYVTNILANQDKNSMDEIYEFLWIYSLDFKEIHQNSSNSLIVEDLIKFALDLDIMSNKKLYKRCKDLPSGALLSIYNKISAYKYSIKGLLNDAHLYSRFSYFFLPKFIKSTGREFTQTHFLNPQGNKFVTAFLAFREFTPVSKLNFNQLKDAFASVLRTTKFKEQVYAMSFKTYSEQKDIDSITYIESYLRTAFDAAKYPINSSYKDQIAWLYPRMKKPKLIFTVKALIAHYFSKDEGYSYTHELDATSSGSQIHGVVLRDEKLCILSNIIGTQASDLYSIYITSLNHHFNLMRNFLTLWLNWLDLKNNSLLKDVLLNFMQIKDKDQCKTNMILIVEPITILSRDKLWDIDMPIVPDELFKFVKKELKIIPLRKSKKSLRLYNFMRALIVARYCKLMLKARANNPWLEKTKILESRALGKLPIMAYPYALGRKGREAGWLNQLEKEAFSHGFDAVDLGAIKDLITGVLNPHFKLFAEVNLTTSKKFLQLVKTYVKYNIKEEIPMRITNNFFIWEYAPYKVKVTRPRMPVSKHKLTLYEKTDILDEGKACSTLPSIITHSAESVITHSFSLKIIRINKLLEDTGLVVGFFKNHDNYGVNSTFSPFLRILIQDSVNELAHSNFLSNLDSPVTLDIISNVQALPIIECTNPHCVKH